MRLTATLSLADASPSSLWLKPSRLCLGSNNASRTAKQTSTNYRAGPIIFHFVKLTPPLPLPPTNRYRYLSSPAVTPPEQYS